MVQRAEPTRNPATPGPAIPMPSPGAPVTGASAKAQISEDPGVRGTSSEAVDWRAAGLTDQEYAQVERLLGRVPNGTELGLFGVLWSEHCAYKHSRPLLSQLPTGGPHVLIGPGENAGAVDLGDGMAVVFRIESHNHPSFVEPYQGAATGVGGILRDVLATGARPIALLNSLRFGDPSDPDCRRLLEQVVAGIAGYGNCVGVPTVGGEVQFEPGYRTNPLVNVMCVGAAPADQLLRGAPCPVGSLLVLFGAPTGRDGIHGATFASVGLDDDAEDRRPAVQVGDPFAGKLLLEASLELAEKRCVRALQDLGAGGLGAATAEVAARAGAGVEMDVDPVPVRETGMNAYEILLSESQERMLAVVDPSRQAQVEAICRAWGLTAAVVGRLVPGGRLLVRERGRVVVDVPVEALTRRAPRYVRPAAVVPAPTWDRERVAEPRDGHQVEAILRRLLTSPGVASRAWIYGQFDHMVQGNTLLRPGAGDAAVLRVPGSQKAVAVAVDGNGRYAALDARRGAALAVAEAARNVSCVGARPLGLTNGLNLGNPERPEIYGQLAQVIEGLAEACRELAIPVTGGNVSLYNETAGRPIDPTPVVGVVGVLDHPERRAVGYFRRRDHAIVLLGTPWGSLGGSEYLKRIHGMVAGPLATIHWDRERAVQQLVRDAIAEGWIDAAHDVSEGGLLVALTEMCFRGGPVEPGTPTHQLVRGADVRLRPEWLARARLDELLFGEAPSRILVALPRDRVGQLLSRAASLDLPASEIGVVGDVGGRLRVWMGSEPWLDVAVEELRRLWEGPEAWGDARVVAGQGAPPADGARSQEATVPRDGRGKGGGR